MEFLNHTELYHKLHLVGTGMFIFWANFFKITNIRFST